LEADGDKIFITDTQKENNLIVHYADALPKNLDSTFTATINTNRRASITKNHSATHLIHSALKQVLGSHVAQKGSLVNEQQTRFDFSHFAKVSDEEILQIEKIVNQKVRENIMLNEQRNVPIQKAIDSGATALFGEKYGDFVRVITFDPSYSVELCGGTHVAATGEIGMVKLVAESAVAAGVRRIEAITGEGAENYFKEQSQVMAQVKSLLNNPKDVVKGVESLIEETNALKKQVEQFVHEKAQGIKKELMSKVENINGVNCIVATVNLPAEAIKNISFELKNRIDNLFCLLASDADGKPMISLIIAENLVAEKSLNATNIIRELAKDIQGGGGGQPFYATAGGKNVDGLKSVLEKASGYVK
jgi:alanyl-tRNA synthetase